MELLWKELAMIRCVGNLLWEEVLLFVLITRCWQKVLISLFLGRLFRSLRFSLELLFFVWTVALGNILTIDNLRKRQILILDWCCMWKKWEISWPPPNPLLYCFWFMVYGVYFDWYSLGYAENSGGAVGLLARKVWEAFVRHRNHKLTF